MIYVGRHLRSAIGTTEPALINPDLPVARHRCATTGHDLAPYPSYHLISAAERAAYLAWLADGRRDAQVPIGVVWLFFFGLERRVLLDAAGDPAVRLEFPVIAEEVRRLRALYGTANPSFHTCSSSLLDAVELLSVHSAERPGGNAPAAPRGERSPVPMALRIALSRYAAAGLPVPADIARSWAWFHPALLPRTPQTRCAQEFDRLFRLRYTQRFGAGLVPRPTGIPLELWYQPSSPGLTTVALSRADLPDVLKEPTATRELGVLVDAVTGALDPYSRWLAKTPDGRGTLAATALLPAELLDRDAGPLGRLASWADAHLADQPSAVFDAAEFTAFWSVARPERMAKDEVVSLMQVLSRIGLGVEPDVRFGGPALTPGPAVLFRLGDDAPDGARAEFRTAATMLHLAAGVVSATGAAHASGAADDTVAEPIVAELATTVRLTAAERTRLLARLRWLLTAEVAGTGLSRRIAALDQPERSATGHFLIAVATRARTVSPAAVAALTSAYRMLGLDTELVIHRLHQRSIGGGSPDRASRRHAEAPVVA
ncbi:MAG: TerB N-terminal domain-containing protein, partial [Pseudonocardia sp.]|nr:TerB N-terminal domain-containing protein [Pseudonocardia sp.]